MRVFSVHQLSNSDLIVEAIYEGQIGSQLGGEAISSTLPGIGNLGGFRVSGLGDDKKFVVLYSSGEDPDWPDVLENSTLIDQYSIGLNASIAVSLSQIMRSATDWTRPAERLPGNFRHNTGESVNPTR